MTCTSCGFENPTGMNFCGGCGTALPLPCTACGFSNPPGFRFCGGCGASLADARPEPPPVDRPPAERRQLTVMFCDVVGSTELSTRLDPEDLRDVIQRYQAACVRAVERFGGYVAQYLGDGLMVYFGYPTARENDAERAVRAGLDILRAVERLSRRLETTLGIELAVRLGAHTGRAVIGQMGAGTRREQLALGQTPNVAARLQALAPPGTLVISEATHRIVAGRFETEALGPKTLKGLSTPQNVYRVCRARERPEFLDEEPAGGSTPLVGRTEELAFLTDRWAAARDGAGQVVCLCGDAGIGKSRLVRAFRRQQDCAAHPCLVFRCSPYHTNSAYHPVAARLQHMLNFYPGQEAADRLDTLAFTAEQHGFDPAEAVPLLAALLSVPLDDRYPAPGAAGRPPQEQTRTLLLALLLQLADAAPLLLIFEDLHWADPSTLELLRMLADRAADAPVLALFTYRPSEAMQWPEGAHIAPLTLNRLPAGDVEAIARQVAGGRDLPASIVSQITERTDGVPLFVEELTKMVIESGVVEDVSGTFQLTSLWPALGIPATLRDSLTARLDRLSTEKELAQLGSVLGRSFSYALLREVAAMDEAALRRALERLVAAEFLYQHGTPPHASYLFKHALIQDVAYDSLLRGQRQRFHLRTARALETHFPEMAEAEPEVLARHYTAAGLPGRAARFWLRAADQAGARSANAEVIHHARKGLVLVENLPDGPGRQRLEGALLLALGPALVATRGYAVPEVREVYDRARALCRDDALPRGSRHLALTGLFAYYFVRLDLPPARDLAEQLLASAQQAGQGDMLSGAHLALGITHYWEAELDVTLEHLGETLRHYDPERHGAAAHRAGQDAAVLAHCYSAMSLWMLGRPDQARRRAGDALQLAERIRHPHSLAFALNFGAWVHEFRGEPDAAALLTARLATLCREQGFEHWLANARVLQAWEAVRVGRAREALHQMNETLELLRRLGVPPLFPAFAELLARAGRPEEGLALLETTLAEQERLGIRLWLPEWRRTRALLYTTLGHPVAEVEAELRAALALAERHRTPALALRAATDLARLAPSPETMDALARCHDAFTEGHGTADLRRARAVLTGDGRPAPDGGQQPAPLMD